MKKIAILLILVVSITNAFSQDGNKPSIDVRFGIGISLLGTGDMQTTMFENEINYKISNFFAASCNIAYGKSDKGVSISASFIQMNLNTYISPFKNNKKNNFRIGAGISRYTASDVSSTGDLVENGEIVGPFNEFEKRVSIGLNIIIENTYDITEKLMVGGKLFTQPYINGDLNSGILVKFGVKI